VRDFSDSIPSDSPPLTSDGATLEAGWNYEQSVQKIEEITARIESGELDLEEVFEQFATAIDYLHQCETFLTERQQQMDLLIETLSNDPDF
jgi:exodeoxyribonuclease VII small subunit